MERREWRVFHRDRPVGYSFPISADCRFFLPVCRMWPGCPPGPRPGAPGTPGQWPRLILPPISTRAFFTLVTTARIGSPPYRLFPSLSKVFFSARSTGMIVRISTAASASATKAPNSQLVCSPPRAGLHPRQEGRRQRQHKPAHSPPDPPAHLVGKFPGVLVLHGHGSAVAVCAVDVLGRFFHESPSEAQQKGGHSKNIDQQHRLIKPFHRIRPFPPLYTREEPLSRTISPRRTARKSALSRPRSPSAPSAPPGTGRTDVRNPRRG